MKPEEINELNRIARLLEEQKQYQRTISSMRDTLRKEVVEGSRVLMYGLVCHTEARDWGKEYFDIKGFFFTFDDAVKALEKVREANLDCCRTPIHVNKDVEVAAWEYSDYDGCYKYEVQSAHLEIPK